MPDNHFIADGYWDIDGTWHATPAETRAAMHACLGDAPAADDLRVIRPGERPDGWNHGQLTFEDGGELRIDDAWPSDLPLGYHEFHADGREHPGRLIVAPRRCVDPPARVWGWAVQLYAARSRASWGMGDLGDLRQLAEWSAALGAGTMLLNPLLAVAPGEAQQSSPYYPATRRFFNPLYLRVEDVPGAHLLGAELDSLAAAGRALNDRRLIDRPAIYRLKMDALRRIWERRRPETDPRFAAFCRAQGRSLDEFGVYCVLAESFGQDWRTWPEAYRRPHGAATENIARERGDDVAFHVWMQWLVDLQLRQASAALPLILDLPVGVDPAGLDAWVWQDTLCTTFSVGAPPDPFQRQGQNWSLPPFIPHRLRTAKYEPLIQSVRASLRYSGGLRIDHVMGLFRLFWIPNGKPASEGAYMRYPADEMLAILALESQRAGAFIVGEDLGTVEPEVREKLREHAMLSFRLLYFEPVPPAQYPALAMATVGTHDLPTLAGVWDNRPAPSVEGFSPLENPGKAGMRQRLVELTGVDAQAAAEQAIAAVYRKLGESPSAVLLAMLDDAIAVREQPNVPGTVADWPNWSLALPGGIDRLAESALAQEIACALRRDGGSHC